MSGVRRIGPEEAALWRQVRQEALRTSPEAFSARLADWETRPLADFAAQAVDNSLFLAFHGAEPVGSISWTRDRDPAHPARCWIEGVFVAPVARGRGLAQALISAALADAKAAGMRDVWLEVGAANAAAQATYRRAGFAVAEGEGRPSPSCGVCEVSMWRALDLGALPPNPQDI